MSHQTRNRAVIVSSCHKQCCCPKPRTYDGDAQHNAASHIDVKLVGVAVHCCRIQWVAATAVHGSWAQLCRDVCVASQ